MGLLRKKDKKSKGKDTRESEHLTIDDRNTEGKLHENTTNYESKEMDNVDSAYSDPYSPTGTENSSTFSGDLCFTVNKI